MTRNPSHRALQFLVLITSLGISLASAQTTIYEQSFTPGNGAAVLEGTSPTIGASNWVASTERFEEDGDLVEGQGSATLSFAPADGLVYTLDASFRNMAGTAGVGAPEQDWVALGFAKGQSNGSTNNDRFVGANVTGKAWMLFRGAATPGTSANFTHLGSATSGNSSSAGWTNAALATTYGGGMDMRVVLDTTGGTGNWTATWHAKLPASETFTEVRATTTLINEDIDSVGVAISNLGIDGALTYFSLTSAGDLISPAIVSKDPHAVSGVYPGANIVATFSEEIVLEAGGVITVKNLDDLSGASDLTITLPDAQVTLSERDLIIDPAANLPFTTNFAVRISPDAIVDSTPSAFAGITDDVTWTFSTAAQDLTAPLLTLQSPADGLLEVRRSSDITATFDDDIILGTGDITIKDLDDGSTTQIISANDTTQVSSNGKVLTINPASSFAAGKNYAVQISAGVVRNFSDVNYAGIPAADDTSWNFQTLETTPNVIFILADDQGWYDYGFMRRSGVEKAALDLNPVIPQVAKTPAIDRLADEGLTYVHGYSAPVCRPSLASIFTGTYPHQHWITGNDLENRPPDEAVEGRMQVLNPIARTLSNELGYTSFQTGKWWEGDFANGGFTHGDTVNSIAGNTSPPQWSGGRPSYVRARHGDWGLMVGRVDYVNDIQNPAHPIPYANTVQTVTDFIDEQVTAEQPFLLSYSPFLPHTPHDPPAGLLSQYTSLGLSADDAKYYANIERFDGGVGAILDHLDAQGIADNTIIVMICDNGRQYDLTTLGKGTPYESGVRTPIIIRWPDRIKPGGAIAPQIIRTPVNMVDIVPTVHKALGLPLFPEMRGIDLLDPAAVAARDTVCGANYDVEILDLPNPWASLESRFAARDGWKLILLTTGDKELYHLYDTSTGAPIDPHETNNLVASQSKLVSELTTAIVNWYSPGTNDFDSWISDPAFGLDSAEQGFKDDPDGDGLMNGLEAWFGTHPGEVSIGVTNLASDGFTTTFTHPQNMNAPVDARGRFYEWCDDLENWYASGDGPEGGTTVTIQATPNGEFTNVAATASSPTPELFLRVRVDQE